MLSHDNHYDVIVVGAGLIGAAFALQLAKKTDFCIALLEHSTPQLNNHQPNQRVVALGQTATQLLQDVGVFQQLNSDACHPYTDMFVWDESSVGELLFSSQDYQKPCLGYMVDAVELTIKLQQAAEQQENLELFYQFRAEQLQLNDDCAVIKCCEPRIEAEPSAAKESSTNKESSAGKEPSADKEPATKRTLSADLIVAADGAQSWVRRQAKIFAHQQPYKQRGIVARIRSSESHQNTAWQIFLQTGPLAVLPLHDNQSSIVWSADDDKASDLLDMSDDEFAAAITNALQNRLGTVELLSERQAFDLSSVRAEHYFKRRLALIGDAAHSIHPLAGQGANLGFKDASVLAELLQNLDEDSISQLGLLQRYQRARKVDNEQTDAMMSMLHKAYQSNASWWVTARGLGMNMVSASSALKSVLVKQAMGL